MKYHAINETIFTAIKCFVISIVVTYITMYFGVELIVSEDINKLIIFFIAATLEILKLLHIIIGKLEHKE